MIYKILSSVFLVTSVVNLQVSAQVDNRCITQTAVCSLKSQIRGTITFGETQGAGCFNNGNLKVTFDLVGFPSSSSNNNDNNSKKDDVYTFRLKTYGEIMPACSGMGPDFGSGITTGELGVFTPGVDGQIYNDTTYIPKSSSIPDRSSIIGRSVGIYAGPYSNYGNNIVVDCCVIGYGLPRASATPTVAPSQGGTSLFGNAGLVLPGANNNNNANPRNTISDDKFRLIGGYGNSRAFDGTNDRSIPNPQFGYQGTARQPFRATSSKGLYGSNPFRPSSQDNNGFRNGGTGGQSYNNIYNRGNNNFNSNRVPVASTNSNNNNNGNSDIRNYYDGARGSPAGGVGGQSSGNGYTPGSYTSGDRNGFSNSQFPSVFSNIGSPDFFNLDGELAGAAFVKGGPEAATGIGGASRGTGGDSSLSSSLAGGFKPPQGPSFQDIYNKPTGESPLSSLGFSDTVSPERRNSISDIFFGDGSIKDTIGLTEEDMFIPRESEESQSSSSYQSDSDDYPDGNSDNEYNDNDDSYINTSEYGRNNNNQLSPPYGAIEENNSYRDSNENDSSLLSDVIPADPDAQSPASLETNGSASDNTFIESGGPKPVYRDESEA